MKGKKGRLSASVRVSHGAIHLENGLVELGFSQSKHGALVSILDKQSGCQLLRDAEAPGMLFRLGLRKLDDHTLEWIESGQATRFRWSKTKKAGVATLTLTASGFAGRKLEVTVRVTLAADSALSVWHAEVKDIGKDRAVYQLTYPIVSGLVKLGDPAPGESLAVPVQGEGYLFKNPYPVQDRLPLCSGAGPETADVGIGRTGGRYPGSLSLQMYAFYNDKAGLYFAAHDAGQHVKEFQMGPFADWRDVPVMAMSHLPGELPGKDAAFDYDTIVGVFHGDWYDAADIYKAWATRQWWCEKKLRDRDIADWMRTGFGVFQMSNYDLPVLKLNHPLSQIADVVNDLSKDAGVPLLALIFNFEAGGAWTGPKGFFPPREGDAAFKDAMSRLRAAGNYGFVYMPGGQWYIKIPYEPPFDSWKEFNAEALPHSIKGPDGKLGLHIWTGYGGWESARLCPATAYTTELTASIIVHSLELGCPVVQIDNFPCGGSEACYDPAHDHPPGHGPWWSEAWGKILAEVRRQARAKDPNSALATEGISENFIPWLDMYDHRAGNMEYFGHYGRGMPMGGETIPLFNYVYNEYIGSYLAAYPECNRPEVLYWTRCLAKSLVQGVVPTGGRYFPTPAEHNPVTIDFYKKIVRATAQECWPYLMFGEMLRPPEIDVPTITAPYCKFFYDGKSHRADPSQRHEVRDRAVQHAAWRGPDGSIGTVFVNISEEKVAFDVKLSGYGLAAKTFDVERITDGTRKKWLKAVRLPRTEQIRMEPLSVTLVIVKREP
jgi:hypothetical protein